MLFVILTLVSVQSVTVPAQAVAAQGDFSIVVIPDTQNEAEHYPEIMKKQFQWIAEQYLAGNSASIAQNIVFATGLGDIVNHAKSDREYQNADVAYDLLDGAGVPYSVSPGNHDLNGKFNEYFGPSRFVGRSYYQGPMAVGANENNYSFFSAGGMDFILINLTYRSSAAVLDWADSLLKANPTRRGIVVQHDILRPDNSWQNKASFLALKDNPNLFLMLCGHMHTMTDGSAYRLESGDDGHTIHVLLTDYQEFSGGGDGLLRLLRFSPIQDKIYVSVYSPTLGGYRTSVSNYEQFELSYDMTVAAAPVLSPTPAPSLIRGDFNGDQLVNLLDYQALIGAIHSAQSHFSLIGSDDYVDLYDYNELLKLVR